MLAIAALLAAVGLCLAGKAVAIHAKAALAQVLLEHAFAKRLETDEAVKAWPWADTWPVARLEIPRLKAGAIVLKGSSGEALAFGPGHLEGTPRPGEPGVSVIAAHRDTHFRFLRDVRTGDEIRITRGGGAAFRFRVVSTRVVRQDASGIDPQREGTWLVLSTCWPFNARTRGDLRFVVHAKLLGPSPREDITLQIRSVAGG